MSDVTHEQLMEAKERIYLLDKAERRWADLQKRIRETEKLMIRLELKLESEQADVVKLTKMSMANLFYTILRSKDEQLELERQQALAAALQLQEAQQELADCKSESRQIGNEITDLGDAKLEYERLMAKREADLRNSPEYSSKLADIEAELTEQRILLKEINEAWTAGKRVLQAFLDASSSLDSAESWGNWDMWMNGGLISTYVKHSHVDGAKQSIHNANHLMRSFRDELADLKRTAHVEVDISGTLKMADYWFDGFITDWIVQGRIKNSHEQVLEAIRKIRPVVNQLQSDHSEAELKLKLLTNQRIAWIEGNRY
jgi:hypothetical protein